MNTQQQNAVIVGDWVFEPALNRISRDGERVELEPIGSRLLEVFVAEPGRVFSADELVAAVWRDRIVSDNPIYKAMANLRRALGDSSSAPRYIETIRKRGYRLVAPVSPLDAAVPAGVDTLSGGDRGEQPVPVWRRRLVAVTVAAAILVVVVLNLEPKTPTLLPDDAPTVAVLPFDDMSPDGDQAYFGEGLAEELIHVLAGQPELGVIGRTSSFAVADGARDLRDIGSLLGARYVVEGSVRRDDDTLRVTAQLIDTRNGLHVWSGNFDRGPGSILDLQTDIANEILEALGSRLDLSDDVAPLPAELTFAAYDAYLRGRHELASGSAGGAGRAETLFLEALAIESGFVPAMTALVESQYRMAFYGVKPSREAFELAAPWVERALRLAPQEPAVHVAAGHLKLTAGNQAEAEQAFRTALELDPDNADALAALAWQLYNLNRSTEATAIFARALSVESAAPLLTVAAAMNAEDLGEFDCSRLLYERAVAIKPDLMNAQFALASFDWRIDGDHAAAEDRLGTTMQLDPDGAIPPATLALVMLDDGRPASAQRWVEAAEAVSKQAYWPLFARMALSLRSGDVAAAEQAAENLAGFSSDARALRVLRDRHLAAGDAGAAVEVYPDWLIEETAVQVDRRNVVLAADLAHALRQAGRAEQAEALARRVLEIVPSMPRRAWRGSRFADVKAALILEGEAAALDRLEQAMAAGPLAMAWLDLEHDRALEPLRALPEFGQVVALRAGGSIAADDPAASASADEPCAIYGFDPDARWRRSGG